MANPGHEGISPSEVYQRYESLFESWFFDDQTNLRQSDAPDRVQIPTLYVDAPADPNDKTVYPQDLNLVNIYRQAREGVVHISGQLRPKDNEVTETKEVTGSGFFVSQDGKLVTDYHVVKDANNLIVETADGRKFKASIEAVSPSNDLALLAVDDKGAVASIHVLPLEEKSSNLAWGDDLVALGYPNGWKDMYVSPGKFAYTCPLQEILPHLDQGLMPGEDPNRLLLETYAHVEGGNSGGPILNSQGHVVGVIGISNLRNKAEATPVEDLLAFLNETRNYSLVLKSRMPLSLNLDNPGHLNLSSAIKLVKELTGNGSFGLK